MAGKALVARFLKKEKKKNVIAKRAVALYFQRYPGVDPNSGIADAPYKLRINGKDKTPANAKTAADGKISFSISARAKAEVEIFGTVYEVKCRSKTASYTSTKGVQQRLKMLGYHVGSADGKKGALTERATLLFQADSNHPAHQPHCSGSKNGTLMIDGIIGDQTKKALRKLVRAHHGE